MDRLSTKENKTHLSVELRKILPFKGNSQRIAWGISAKRIDKIESERSQPQPDEVFVSCL